ncbi:MULTISPECIES: glycosyltransferase family A protein [Vagococcus]|nr:MULTISPECIES: glycosyltransferase family A protein [Vagococcus]HCM90771.1 glycosyltransferase family 2 protein [Vagococcus sp.]
MKVLSIVVPCYNSVDYMERCINSLLVGGEEVEIIIVNDGSRDGTEEIGKNYQKLFPNIVKYVYQENGGHGEAINTGLSYATGLYLKVVDSDDWLEVQAFGKLLKFLIETSEKEQLIDMVISNYVYEKQEVKNKKIMEYRSFLPQNCQFTWDDVSFPLGKYLLMHSVIYRTSLLKELVFKLPQHTFYVDNLYVFQPLPLVKSLYYLDVDLYRYYIGREDQSVNEKIMISRIDQQLFVNKRLVKYYSTTDTKDENILDYMRKYVEIITTISSILLIKEGTEESLGKKKELWAFIKETDQALYKKLRYGLFGIGVNLPGTLGRKTAVRAYQIAQKRYGFN